MMLHPITVTSATVFNQRTVESEYQSELFTGQAKCPVALERLRLLTLSYYDMQGEPHFDGQMIVLDAIADDVIDVFRKLYYLKFPIDKIKLMSDYKNDDNKALIDNNSSSFNCREITGGSQISLHAYGVAIDINPVQNPYLETHEFPQGNINILPTAGEDYINRSNVRPGMVEPVVKIFRQHGFNVWGGDWKFPIDYQHFQPSRFVAEMLAGVSPSDAKTFFKLSKKYPRYIKKFTTTDSQPLLDLYRQDSTLFMQKFSKYVTQLKTQSSSDLISRMKKDYET